MENFEQLEEILERLDHDIDLLRELAEDDDSMGLFFKHRSRHHKGDLMAEVEQLTTDFATLTAVVPVFITDYNTIKAAYDAAVAAGSASVPLTALDPFITSAETLIANIGAADPNAVPAPPVVVPPATA